MSEDQAVKEAEDRDAKKAVTVGLTDQETIEQLSSTGNAAKNKRRESMTKHEEDAKAEAREQAIRGNGIEVEVEREIKSGVA